MKKLIGTVVLAALVAGAAFADITMGAWLRVLYMPVASDGEDMVQNFSNSWGWGARSARVDINAVSEDGKAGMVMGAYNDMWGGLGQADDAKMWIKPIEQVKITFGKFDSPSGLRGDFCYGSWNWYRPVNWIAFGEGMTMSGIKFGTGVLVEVEPMENLYILAGLGDADQDNTWADAYKQFDKFQAGFKYTIDGIGVAKVQWLNNVERAGDDMARTGAVEGAFDLTAVENLFVTFGVRFDIFDKDKITGSNIEDYQQLTIALGASYKVMDNFTVYGDFAFAKYDLEDSDPAIGFGLGADYGVMDGLTLNVEFRGLLPNNSYDPVFSFLIGAQYACSSNGYIGIAFQGLTNGNLGDGFKVGGDSQLKANAASPDGFMWAVPIAMSVWF